MLVPSSLSGRRKRSVSVPGSRRILGFEIQPSPIPSAWIQSIVQVTNDDDADNQLYKVKLRYWDRITSAWALVDKEWDLDASDLDMALSNDNRVVAYWDATRSMYVPTGGSGTETGLSSAIEFTLTAVLEVTDEKAAAEVDLYYDGNDPGRYLDVYNKLTSEDYMFEGVIGAMGMAKYNKRLERYVIWNLQC